MRARVWRSDDGVSLSMVLIFVTVVAVIVGAVLSFADVNFRATVQLRLQNEASAAADGAAQIAINALRNGSYNGTGTCFDGSNTLNLPPISGGASAAVTCSLDADLSASDGGLVINSTNKPPTALAVRRSSFNLFNGFEDSLEIDANNKHIKVRGPIASNNNIRVLDGDLVSTASVKARGDCSTPVTGVPKTCNLNSDPGGDPGSGDSRFNPPAVPTATPQVPACNAPNQIIEFTPGAYSGPVKSAQLRNMMKEDSNCQGSTFYFPPGVYYFDLNFGTAWVFDTGSVVAGKYFTGALPPRDPHIPGSCKSAVPPVSSGPWTKQDADGGTVFVFANDTHIEVGDAQFEICGPYSLTKPPIAIYGLRDQDGCVNLSILDGRFGCPVIKVNAAASNRFVVQGTTYVPRGAVRLNILSSSIQQFRAGLVARSLRIDTLSFGADLAYNVFELPDDAAGTGLRTVVNLDVWVCPGGGACSPGAAAATKLRAKVAITDPSGSVVLGQRQVTILNWNVQR